MWRKYFDALNWIYIYNRIHFYSGWPSVIQHVLGHIRPVVIGQCGRTYDFTHLALWNWKRQRCSGYWVEGVKKLASPSHIQRKERIKIPHQPWVVALHCSDVRFADGTVRVIVREGQYWDNLLNLRMRGLREVQPFVNAWWPVWPRMLL